MRIVLYASDTRRETDLVEALVKGFKKHNETVEVRHNQDVGPNPGYDLATFIGVRNKSRRIWENCQSIGQPTLMLDKGYFNRELFHRFSPNGPQPYFLGRGNQDTIRLFRTMRVELRDLERRPGANRIIYVEATQKYYYFHKLGLVGDYAAKICGEINDVLAAHNDKRLRITYRPKRVERDPNGYHKPPVQPPNTDYSDPSKETLAHLFPTTHCVVVHGSNAGVEAAINGIPVLSIGTTETNPLQDLINVGYESLFDLKLPPREKLIPRLAELAWCQYDHREIGMGIAWDNMKPWVKGVS